MLDRIVAGKETKVGEASRVLMEAGRVLSLSRSKVEASEREVKPLSSSATPARTFRGSQDEGGWRGEEGVPETAEFQEG